MIAIIYRVSRTLKGKFRPLNPDKYKGDPGQIYYRSSWELEFMRWCDAREEVLWWQSEEKRIPYYDPITKRRRTYYPDFLLARQCHDGIIRETLVEAKPSRQVRGPAKNPKRKSKAWLNEVYTYTTNMAKWKAAAEWCEDRGIDFQLITEKELKL